MKWKFIVDCSRSMSINWLFETSMSINQNQWIHFFFISSSSFSSKMSSLLSFSLSSLSTIFFVHSRNSFRFCFVTSRQFFVFVNRFSNDHNVFWKSRFQIQNDWFEIEFVFKLQKCISYCDVMFSFFQSIFCVFVRRWRINRDCDDQFENVFAQRVSSTF